MQMSSELELQWLAESLTRRMARWVSVHDRKVKSTVYRWEGLTEADSVSVLQSILDAAGFYTWRESRYPRGKGINKLDLWAETPIPEKYGGDWLIEVKNVWDTSDLRLKEKRFHESKEFLKDFRNLANTPDENFKRLVVWVIYSESPTLESATKGSETYKAADVSSVVAKEFSAEIVGQDSLDVSALTGEFASFGKFVHVLIWSVPEAQDGLAKG